MIQPNRNWVYRYKGSVSLARNVDRMVSMKESGSFLKSFREALIKQIESEAVVGSFKECCR